MLSRHYAPKTETYLTNDISELLKSFEGKQIGLLLFKNPIQNNTIIHQEILMILTYQEGQQVFLDIRQILM